jgi:hypothetical protein
MTFHHIMLNYYDPNIRITREHDFIYDWSRVGVGMVFIHYPLLF